MIKWGILSLLAWALFKPTLIDKGNCNLNSLELKGNITSYSVSRVMQQIHECPAYKVIIVDSMGGDPMAAMALGQVILNQNMDIKVENHCLSSCALFLALSAKSLLLSSSDVVGFHHSQASLYKIFNQNLPMSNLDWDRIQQVSTAEIEYFKDNNIDLHWLYKPMEFIQTQCILTKKTLSKYDIPRYRSLVHVWMPDTSEFNNYVQDVEEPKLPSKSIAVTVIKGGKLTDIESVTSNYSLCKKMQGSPKWGRPL